MSYLDERLKLIEQVPSTFVTRVDALRQDLFDELVILLTELESQGGALVASPENLQRIEDIIEGLGNFLFNEEAEYLAAVREFVSAQGIAASLADDYFGVARSDKWQAVLKSQQFKTAKIFDRESISAELGALIRNEITNRVSSGAQVKDTAVYLREFIVGTDELDGRLTKYAKSWALTSYANAEAQYVFTAATDVGVETWLYSGGLVQDSRDFCIQRAGQTFTTEEVKSWAALDWAGKIAGTDESTIFANRGGWNCSHVLMPVL